MGDSGIANLWKLRLNDRRRKPKSPAVSETIAAGNELPHDSRTEIERDFDRVLFSTPVRRLADKTQVFPLDRNDSVRTRLTHSYEVSNLARSMGVAIVQNPSFTSVHNSSRDIPSVLAAIGLAHDIGNPPFGHQGEHAIRHWFTQRKPSFFTEIQDSERYLFNDFELFEGNAQGFRLLTRLQLLNDTYGLDLTYATLAALMKYPVSSDSIDEAVAAKKKFGFFFSEKTIAEEVLSKVGLSSGKRHPLAYVMEACDDIAYVVLDAEDTVKKGLASFSDLVAFLKHEAKTDSLTLRVVGESQKKHEEYREIGNLSPAELNDISMQRFRVFAIGEMIRAAIQAFFDNYDSLVSGCQQRPLLAISQAEKLRSSLKKFSLRHGYSHKSVIAIELNGFNTIQSLMDLMWYGIRTMTSVSANQYGSQHPFARYVFSRVSENYRRVFADPSSDISTLPTWYRKFQLLTDMISGMTDSYALDLYRELKEVQGACDCNSLNLK